MKIANQLCKVQQGMGSNELCRVRGGRRGQPARRQDNLHRQSKQGKGLLFLVMMIAVNKCYK